MDTEGASSWDPLIRTDFERFMKICTTDDQAERIGAYQAAHACAMDILMGEVVRYGIFNDASMIPPLTEFYEYCVNNGMPREHRRQVLEEVALVVRHVSFITANALLPFIAVEYDGSIVSTATVEYVSLAQVSGGDPMSRPKELMALIKRGQLANRGAIFGGLLSVGDPRVCKLLWDLKSVLKHAELNEAVKCHTGLMKKATVEFYLDWMESLRGDATDGTFGLLASGLALIRRQNQADSVKTGLRPFPFYSVSPDEHERLAAFIPLEEFTAQIEPRLRELARLEPEPKVMTTVLEIWGLEPGLPP